MAKDINVEGSSIVGGHCQSYKCNDHSGIATAESGREGEYPGNHQTRQVK